MISEKTEQSTMQLSQCGTVLISSDHRLHALECFYCDAIYTLWEEFIKHVKDTHKQLEQLHKDSVERRRDDDVSNKSNIVSPSDEPELKEEQLDRNTELSLDNTVQEEVEFLDEERLDENLEFLAIDDDTSSMDNKSTADASNPFKIGCYGSENVTEDFEINEVDYLSTDGKEEYNSKSNNAESEENNLASDHSTSNLAIESNVFFEQTPEEDVFAFVEVIKQHPLLWKTKSKCNRNHQKYLHTLEVISKQLNITPQVVENRQRSLISWFQSETKLRNSDQKLNSALMSKYYKFFEKCLFLASGTSCALNGSTESESSTVSNVFACPNCDKVFSKKKYLNVHARRHAKDFAYKCKFCDKRTVTSTDMTTHMRVHTGEKPYVCDSCGKGFKTCSVFNAHKRKHELPQFQCSVCPKTYFNSHDLKNHTNAHLNKRDYRCEFCSKAFTSAKILYSHKMNTHSELRKTFCKICRRCFTHIKYHMKNVHQVVDNRV